MRKGQSHTEEAKRKIGLKSKGRIPWNKGIKGIMKPNKTSFKKGNKINLGKKHSEETRRKISKTKKGQIPWNKGLTKETDERVKKYSKPLSEETKRKIGLANKGKKYPKISERMKGKNNPCWNGGTSFEPYGLEFNKKLKEQIRKRDNYICQECKIKENGEKLSIHHIDYNKRNNELKNLIALCRKCNAKVNFNRKDWTIYFQDKIKNT